MENATLIKCFDKALGCGNFFEKWQLDRCVGLAFRSPSPSSWWKNRFGILPDLLRGLEELVIAGVVVVLAIVCLVGLADLRPVLVSSTQVVRSQVLAVVVDHQVPRLILNEQGPSTMHQIPPQVVEIIASCWCFNRQRIVSATFR